MNRSQIRFASEPLDVHMGKSKHGKNVFLLIVFATISFVLSVSPNVFAGIPVSKNLFITDVTTVSFSVIWTTDEPCTANLEVYSGVDGSSAMAGASIIPHPILSGDSAIRTAAEDSGVMKVMVTGLEPDTTYYFKTLSTSKSTSERTEYPADSPYLSVKTQSETTRTYNDNGEIKPFSNDVIIEPCRLLNSPDAAQGSLLVATISGVNYPITAFVGDGATLPFAIIDLNNAFSNKTNNNIDLTKGENLTLLNYRGINGNSIVTLSVPDDEGGSGVKNGAPDLLTGANFVSFPLQPDNSDTSTVLNSIVDHVESIWTYNAESGEWLFWDKTSPSFLKQLTNINSNSGFWLITNSDTSLVVNGNFSSNPIQLFSGQNLVGFQSIQEMEVNDAIESIYNNIESIWTIDDITGDWVFWDKTSPPFLIGLKTLKPGKAYWFTVTANCIW